MLIVKNVYLNRKSVCKFKNCDNSLLIPTKMHNLLPISLFWSNELVLLRHWSSLVVIHPWWENHHRECEIRCVRFLCFDHAICSPTTSSVFLLTFHPWLENHHCECEIRLVFRFLLQTITVTNVKSEFRWQISKFHYINPVRPYWFIYLFKETCFTFDYRLKCAVRDPHSQEAFPIFGSHKMCHHLGYPYINNQCSSLVDITYASYTCHEPGRIGVSIGGSISEIFSLVRWMFKDANEASLRLVTGLIAKLLVIGGNRAKDQTIDSIHFQVHWYTYNRPNAFEFILVDASKEESSLVI